MPSSSHLPSTRNALLVLHRIVSPPPEFIGLDQEPGRISPVCVRVFRSLKSEDDLERRRNGRRAPVIVLALVRVVDPDRNPCLLQLQHERQRPAVAAYTKKTTFHSLRHNYRDALRDTEMSGEMVRALGGWSNRGNTADDYGS